MSSKESLKSAVDKVGNNRLRVSLSKKLEKDDVSAKNILRTTQFWVAFTIIRRLVASFATFGLAFGVYLLRTAKHNYDIKQGKIKGKTKRYNYITAAYHETKEAIADLQELAKEHQATTQASMEDEDPDKKEDSFVSEDKEVTEEKEKEDTNRRSQDDSMSIDIARKRYTNRKETMRQKYAEATSKTRVMCKILSNGHLYVCDQLNFNDGKTGYINGIFYGKDETSKDPILNNIPKNFQEFSDKVNLAKRIPFLKNGKMMFLYQNNDNIFIIGNKFAAILKNILADKLIPTHYNPLGNPPTFKFVSLFEYHISFNEVNLNTKTHDSMSLDGLNVSEKTVYAFNAQSSMLYFIQHGKLCRVELIDCKTPGKLIESHKAYDDLENVAHFCISENGETMAIASKDGTITIYNIQAFNTESGAIGKQTSFKVEGSGILDLRFVDGDKDLLIATDNADKPAVRIDNIEDNLDTTAVYCL